MDNGILVKNLQDRFVIIDNYPALDNRLSLEARGLFYFINTLPDGDSFDAYTLSKMLEIDISKVESALNELDKFGILGE